MVSNMEKRIIRVGSRESALAVAQTWLVLHQIEAAHPEIEFELVTMKTTGDKILDRTLDKIGGKGLFVKELDRALRNGEVDITVHSLKDVPMEVPQDLPLLAFAKRGDPRDAAGSAPSFGDRKGYQMDFHNRKEALKEAALDVKEGADILMVKPAMSYLDIVRDVADNFNLPVAASPTAPVFRLPVLRIP